MNELVSINILTWNSRQYIEKCLAAVFEQSHRQIEVNILDNGSEDGTQELLKEIFNKNNQFSLRLFFNKGNLGFSAGHNQLIKESKGDYIIVLNHDVILERNFIEEVLSSFAKNDNIASVQGKIYQYNDDQKTKIIDTTGFKIFKSGRIIDEGQGQKDAGQFSEVKEIFGANGAAPAYRRIALNDIKLINTSQRSEYFDEDFFSYVEDVDLAWRLRWRGWICLYNPEAIAWHDRTTSKHQRKGYVDFIRHRKSQGAWARKIGWRNQWLLLVKNQPLINFFRFFFYFFWRQLQLFFYILFFEAKTLSAVPDILKMLPRMIKKRKLIISQRKISPAMISRWFA